MRLLDLSFRVKLPLLGALWIVVSALCVSSTLMIAAYAALREDFRVNSELLGRSLAPSLLQAMLHDDTWHAFETVRAPTRQLTDAGPVKAETLLVVDKALDVFVSAHPRVAPILAPLRSLGPDYAALAEQIASWGYRGAALGVVVGNEPAIAFYESLGGRGAGKYIDPGPLWRSDNLIFVWDEVSDLIGAASR